MIHIIYYRAFPFGRVAVVRNDDGKEHSHTYGLTKAHARHRLFKRSF